MLWNVGAAEATLSASETTFAEITAALADLGARRSALDRAIGEHSERLTRLGAELGEVERELASLEAAAAGPDLAALAGSVEAAQVAVAEAEATALRAEAAHSAARQALDAARGPLDHTERRVQRLDAESRTLARLLGVDAQKLWPPAIDLLSVDKGYEAALAAALGDDLEVPVDPAASMRWAGAPLDPADPELPPEAEPLARHVNAPPELARRLARHPSVERVRYPGLGDQIAARYVEAFGPLLSFDVADGEVFPGDLHDYFCKTIDRHHLL